MDLGINKGRPHPAPGIGARREYPEIQMVHQGPATPRVELARRKEQRRDGLYHLSPHWHWDQRPEHAEQMAPSLEGPWSHSGDEQQHWVLHPDAQPAEEDRHREFSSPGTQEQIGKPPSITSSGKEETIHKIGPCSNDNQVTRIDRPPGCPKQTHLWLKNR